MSEGWARVRNAYQCCDFTVIFKIEGSVESIYPIFLLVRLPLRYKDIHYTQTIYLAIAGSTHYSISYLNRRL